MTKLAKSAFFPYDKKVYDFFRKEARGVHPFFAVLSRMKHIRRWGLMRCTREENLCEHSFETAVLAHALAVLRNERFGGPLRRNMRRLTEIKCTPFPSVPT